MLRAKPKELRWATLPKTLRSLVELTKNWKPGCAWPGHVLNKTTGKALQGALLQEFGVWVRPRSVTCINISLTPRMRHTRVSQTVCRDIWRPAIETSSIPSLHIIRSRIRNQIESRIENRKEPNGPIRKSNCLTKKKFHIPCATLNSYLGWLMRCKVALTTNLFTETTLPWKFHLPYAIPDQASLLCANFVPTSISPTLYGLL